MEFGSKYVYNYDDSDEETVSDDEYEGYIEDTSNPLRAEEQKEDADDNAAATNNSSSGIGDAAADDKAAVDEQQSQHQEGRSWMQMFKSKLTAVVYGQPQPQAADEHQTVAKPKKKHAWMLANKEAIAAAANDVKGKKWRRADTNIVAVKFDQLLKPSNMHAGDAVRCSGCQAILSHISKITQNDDDEQKIWKCEFCDEANVIDVLPDEVPKEADVTYMIQPALSTTASSVSGVDSAMLVFCIDISGSMSGQIGSKTRLQCVQMAVSQQLDQIVKDNPTRKVALVVFESSVKVIGDGTVKVRDVSSNGDLRNYDALMKIGSEIDMPGDIASTHSSLKGKVSSLRTEGSTALGPALLISVMMAAKTVGSKVIICTDGEANVGLGSLSGSGYEQGSAFYEKLGKTALENGVSVSVLTVAGTDCKLIELGEVARATGGQVNIVDPRKLAQEFGQIFVESFIAVQVEATFLVHKGLYIRGEQGVTSYINRQIGNVTKDTEVTFEFGVRTVTNTSDKKDLESSQGAVGGVSEEAAGPAKTETATVYGSLVTALELPFQVQIHYTDLDGAVALRVLTQVQPVTRDRQEAEKHINAPVVGCHAAKQSSEFAMNGMYAPSRLNTFMYQRLFARNTDDTDYSNYISRVRDTQNKILCDQQFEARRYGRTVAYYEDFEGDDVDSACRNYGSKISSQMKYKQGMLSRNNRRFAQSDCDAQNLYAQRSTRSSAWTD